MALLLRSIPERMYLGGEFPGLSEALEELGLTLSGEQTVFWLGRTIAHWKVETKPSSHPREIIDGPRLVSRLTMIGSCLKTIEYALGTHPEDHWLELDEYPVEMYNFPYIIARIEKELAGILEGRSIRNFLVEFLAQGRTLARASASIETKVRAEISKSGPRGVCLVRLVCNGRN
jgi:hypothetical protein